MVDAPEERASSRPRRRRHERRIAIVGTGLAGLTAARLLSESKEREYEVHLFEKADRIGMDAASIDVRGCDGRIHRVDSPMRAVQGGTFHI